jgi:hypothetical protein
LSGNRRRGIFDGPPKRASAPRPRRHRRRASPRSAARRACHSATISVRRCHLWNRGSGARFAVRPFVARVGRGLRGRPEAFALPTGNRAKLSFRGARHTFCIARMCRATRNLSCSSAFSRLNTRRESSPGGARRRIACDISRVALRMTTIDPTDSGRLWASYHFDSHSATRLSQRAVSCDERGIQRFSEGQISRIISRQIVPHLPNPGKQDEMRIAGEWKINEIGERFGASLSGDDRRAHVPTQNLRDFEESGWLQR